jgi:hypothetical protein
MEKEEICEEPNKLIEQKRYAPSDQSNSGSEN